MRISRYLAVGVVVLSAVMAHAETAIAGDGIVLESYTGTRSEDASRLLSPVLDELATRGFVAGSEVVGRKFESRVSRPAITGGGLAADFAEQVEQGHKAWIAGRFDDAVKLLAPLVDAAHANPGAFAQNQPLRERLLKALIALALSQQRMGDPSATRQTFGEILRSFPDTVLSRGSYGPDAFTLFEEVRKVASASGRGRLNVKVSNDTAVVFINERFQNVGSAVKGDLLPGEYRVFAQLGKQLSRSHRVVIKANEEASVTIDAEFDISVHSSPKWTGFRFADGGEREQRESSYAAAFANAIEARAVVVIGIDQVRGRPAVVGSLVNLMNGREIRRASLHLDPDPPVDRLRALARFLAGDQPTPDIDVQIAGDAASAPVGTGEGVQIGDFQRPRGGLWGGWRWIGAGATVVTLGIGAYVLSVDGDCADEACIDFRETSNGGWATIAGGGVLAGITVLLFMLDDGDPAPKRSAFVIPARGGAYAGFSTRF
ncbi:MAG: hypothetical protein H0X17_07740 [Deltaproteobacteria bacterium]|nr:hypothetical protein [Deltaproteobacteria bacterium]